MTIANLVKRIQDIMRQDAGVDGDAQRISQLVWLLFLKVYDAKEEEWEFMDDNYESIIPEELKWRSWAPDNKDGKALTGGALLDFVNNQLFPTLKDSSISFHGDVVSCFIPPLIFLSFSSIFKTLNSKISPNL